MYKRQLYDPEENNLAIDMWLNSDGDQVKTIMKNINSISLSKDASEILKIALLTNSYIPQNQINGDTFKSKDAFQITLQAKQPSRYTISGYRVLRGSITGDQDTAGFQNYDVQELNITIDRPTTIIIRFKKVVPIEIPSVTLSGTSFKYNKT